MSDAVSFDTTGWDEQSREPQVRRWKNSVNKDGLGLYYFAIPPDIAAPLKQVDQLRHHTRLSLAQSNGGIIEHAVIQLADIPVIRQILKIRQNGMMYYIG